ncbi:Hypothetical protein Deide_1p01050 (plasmid) [Deinococcus deserti VCD115]|uniref:Uncharacterized protein n=2 Tax=Deinococcus TaxID=1298 RepID=C1D288_DEIDV|nr:Hypothetical protein Deide_1p01050 [Deinococcus deserti VCD115]
MEDAAALLMSEWRYDTHPPYQSEKRTMSAAFEITQEDLRAALDRLNLPADETTLERAAEVAFAENERITKAALCGEHLEEQTRCGMDELVAVLSETLGAGG